MSERTRIRGIAQREAPRPRRVEGAAVLALSPAPGPQKAGSRWEETQATVAVRGELDRDALWAVDYTIGRAALEAGRIVLDLREVTHLDYAGVSELVARRSELRARGGDLAIAVR
ncbi:MAG TPA: STAS domain-containing protein, partial [Myxococcales bacterium]|nr:STAS domain-containing protein [Myxococcales bacterium]